MMRQLKATSATPANFQTFGALINNDGKRPDGGDDNFNWWERIALLEGLDKVSINLLEAKKRALDIDKLEYHQNTPEVIIPLDGEVILVVAPAGRFTEDQIKAFTIERGKGVILNSGVRHFIPYPLDANVNCLIVFKDATGSADLIFDQLSEMYQILI